MKGYTSVARESTAGVRIRLGSPARGAGDICVGNSDQVTDVHTGSCPWETVAWSGGNFWFAGEWMPEDVLKDFLKHVESSST